MTAESPAAQRRARLAEELRAIPKGELKRFWAELGYVILPAAPEWHDRPETTLQKDRLIAGITDALADDLAAVRDVPRKKVEAIVRDFYDLIPTSPVPAKKGGNGFNGCLQVYAAARLLQPGVIIESGVFRGQTTWVLRQACPAASLFCFDPNLEELVYRDPNASYSTEDWSFYEHFGTLRPDTLAFFDDHMDQGRRVLEAHERGIKTLLFDDNAPAERIHTVGGPPIPSLDMFMDSTLDGQDLSWTYRGKRYGCHIDAPTAVAVRKAVATLRNFKDMHRVTGYTPARITYVSLR